MPAMREVPESTVARLSLYLRLLSELETAGVRTVSSQDLARRCGTSAAQLRKDLSFFGSFGTRGRGYAVAELERELRSILGLERRWQVALIGAGRIGRALFGYRDLERQGFDIVAVYDSDPGKIGAQWQDLVVRADSELETGLPAGVQIAIIAVPAESAQKVVERLVGAGVRAILNFAPVTLQVPAHVVVKTVNMALELEGLSYALVNESRGGRTVRTRAAAARR
jgi:redox-sensing transcriptional repressor